MEQKWNYMENKANEILDCTTNCISRFTPPSLADEVSVEDYFRQLVKLGIFTETEIRYELEEDF